MSKWERCSIIIDCLVFLQLSEDFQIDSPSYDFKKLDPDNEDDRKLFNAYLAWEGDFGCKVNQGKIFK